MPLFEYKGLNSQGKNTKGTIDSENLRAARSKLKKDGIFVSQITDKEKARVKKSSTKATSGGISVEDLASLTRQLASLIKANVPLVDSLTAVSEQTEKESIKNALADIKNMVNEGSSLHKGLQKYPKIFDNIFVTMCEAGESTGTLDTILIRLAEFKEAQAALKSKVSSALIYPAIMLLFTFAMLGILFVFVVPQMVEVFDSMEAALPWYTQVVIGISGILVDYWYLVIGGVFAIGYLFRTWKNSEEGTKTWDRFILKIPVIGKMARMIAVSRFTRTLATLLQGGVPMLGALDIVRNVVGNHVLALAIDQARENISEGESIAGPLKKSGQTGELENMLTQVSDSYDFEVKNKLTAIASSIEPIMIIVMAILVGGIVISIMVPMFNLSKAVG
jgi:general secretion pathway protein F